MVDEAQNGDGQEEIRPLRVAAHPASLPGASGELRRVVVGARPGSREASVGGTDRADVNLRTE